MDFRRQRSKLPRISFKHQFFHELSRNNVFRPLKCSGKKPIQIIFFVRKKCQMPQDQGCDLNANNELLSQKRNSMVWPRLTETKQNCRFNNISSAKKHISACKYVALSCMYYGVMSEYAFYFTVIQRSAKKSPPRELTPSPPTCKEMPAAGAEIFITSSPDL